MGLADGFYPEQAMKQLEISRCDLFRHLLVLMEEGYLQRREDGFILLQQESKEGSASAVHLSPAHTPAAGLLQYCGERLADVLRGDIDPVELIFGGEGKALVETVYRESTFLKQVVSQILSCLEQVTGEHSDNSLRILEVGAGTGSLTRLLLPALVAFSEQKGVRLNYLFTDISSAFIDDARHDYSQCPAVSFGVLDISREPFSQLSGQGSACRDF